MAALLVKLTCQFPLTNELARTAVCIARDSKEEREMSFDLLRSSLRRPAVGIDDMYISMPCHPACAQLSFPGACFMGAVG